VPTLVEADTQWTILGPANRRSLSKAYGVTLLKVTSRPSYIAQKCPGALMSQSSGTGTTQHFGFRYFC